jgi:nucleoside-diphosphate-sugar epimerase
MAKLVIGCGYLGGRVAGQWLSQGHEVYATTRSERRADELRHLGVKPVRYDVLDLASLPPLPRADTVVHSIALDRTSGRTMRDLYVGGLTNLLSLLPKPRRFLYVGSTGVYGQEDGGRVDEDSATEPKDASGKVVLEAEQALRQMFPEAVVLRFAGIYGPGRILREQAIRQGEPIAGDPDRWLNLIHVEDGAGAVLAAEANGQAGETYNVSDGHPVRRREFYSTLARLLGAPEPRFVPPEGNASHERANRRIGNRRLMEDLGLPLRYRSYEVGLVESLTG